jgi:drug/metabolite transporter (DMT)-like permease
MTAGLFAAVGACLCYGAGSVLQSLAAGRAGGQTLNVRGFLRVGRQLPYVAGLMLDLAGFVLNVVALRSLPLFLVQSLVAASVGVTAAVAIPVLGARLTRAETISLCVLVTGLTLLALAARPGAGRPLPLAGQWALLALLPLMASVSMAAARRRGGASVMVLAGCAGADFAAVAVAARALAYPRPWWHLVTELGAWAIVGFGVIAMLSFTAALHRGSVTVATAVMSGVETVLPSLIGLTLLGDRTRAGDGWALALAGFALTLAAVTALAPRAAARPVP